MQLLRKENFVHYDSKKGIMLDDSAPRTKTSKKYGLAALKAFK